MSTEVGTELWYVEVLPTAEEPGFVCDTVYESEWHAQGAAAELRTARGLQTLVKRGIACAPKERLGVDLRTKYGVLKVASSSPKQRIYPLLGTINSDTGEITLYPDCELPD